MTFTNINSLIRPDVSSESSARQRIHMKNQALFSLNDKSKKFKYCLLQFLFGPLRVKGTNLLLKGSRFIPVRAAAYEMGLKNT